MVFHLARWSRDIAAWWKEPGAKNPDVWVLATFFRAASSELWGSSISESHFLNLQNLKSLDYESFEVPHS